MEHSGYLILAVIASGIAVAGKKYFDLSPNIGFALFTIAIIFLAVYVYKLIKG